MKPLALIPGWDASVSPSVGVVASFNAFSFTMATGWAVSVSLRSIAPPTTVTRSASAVRAGLALRLGLGAAGVGVCAKMIGAAKSIAACNKNCFINVHDQKPGYGRACYKRNLRSARG